MVPVITPFQVASLAVETSLMIAEAQMVIGMRLLGMAGMWSVGPGEQTRMVQEKTEAMLASGRAAGRAMRAGKDAGAVALAALKPVRARTRKNAARLVRQGPGLPG